MLKVESFYPSTYESNSYLLIKDDNSILIDPSIDNKTLRNFISETKLIAIIITHGHYDHFMKLESILKDYPNTKIYLHHQAWVKIQNPNLSFAKDLGHFEPTKVNEENLHFIDNQKELTIENFNFKLHYLPGHTNCSTGFEIENNLFIGDVLFKDSIGRYDLPTGSYKSTIETIRIIKKLNQDLYIYPGHEESFYLKEVFKRNSYLN